jgi:tetratricopeptide (TPR) repeat protein
MTIRQGVLVLGILTLAARATSASPMEEPELSIPALDAQADALATKTLRLEELSLRERIADLWRTSPSLHTRDAVAALRDLAALYGKLGPLERAEDVFREAIALRESIAEPGPPEIKELLRELDRVLEQLRPDDPEREAILLRLTSTDPTTEDLYRLGRYQAQRSDSERAIETFDRALEREGTGSGDDRWPWLLLGELGRAYERSDQRDKAEDAYRRAVDTAERALGTRHPQLVQPLARLGAFYVDAGRYQDALPLLERASALDRLAWGEKESVCSCSCGSSLRELLVKTYQALGKTEELGKLPPEPQAKTASEAAEDADTERVIELRSHGRIREALDQAEVAVALTRGRNRGDSPELAERLRMSASILLYQGRGAEALERIREALKILECDADTPPGRLAELHLLASNAASSVSYRDSEVEDFMRKELDARLALGHRQRAAILLQQLATRVAPIERGPAQLESLEHALALWREMADDSTPEAVTIRTEIALTQVAQGRLDEAERSIVQLLPLAPRQSDYRRQRILEAATQFNTKMGREVGQPNE